MKQILWILALLALPLSAQDRVITSSESAQGFFDVTIAGGASLSSSVGIGRSCTPVALMMPAAWTAAAITFRASPNSATPADLYDGGSEVMVPADAARYIVLEANIFFTTRVIQLRSGTSSVPVNQGATRTIRIICR